MLSTYSVGDKLYFERIVGDTLIGLEYCADSAKVCATSVGQVVSRSGVVQTILPLIADSDSIVNPERLKLLLQKSLDSLKDKQKILRGQCKQMDYYAQTHSAADDGYNEVMALREVLNAKSNRIDTLQKRVEEVLHQRTTPARRKHWYYIDRKAAEIQDAVPINKTRRALVCLKPKNSKDQSYEHLSLWHKYCIEPSLLVMDGDSIPCTISPRLAGYLEMWFAEARYVKYDTLGNTYHYVIQDSLYSAQIVYADGSTYDGMVDKNLEATGYGMRLDANGYISCGEWKEDMLSGTGFMIDDKFVKCGTWKSGRFQGERMLYTSDRVYGIDISRYQHEIGRKRYQIDWRNLRIRHLGKASRKRIQGVVDYPVSFVYIKATQGTSIINKYYAADLRGALNAGIPVAAYHFFSMKPGKPQADFFIRHAKLGSNTLPPMLDVEPTEREIERMGGEQVLFREMLAWLKQVEKACNRRPILYISQTFVNKHMPHAPASLRDYDVWIARYGEFKPYIHLHLWQLSYDGRVNGIHGEVDINVFNGTKAAFREWIRR